MTRREAPVETAVPHGASSRLARSAGILAIGSAGSRGLGLLREIVIAALFGASGEVSAFRIAAQVPVLLYDLLIGGMLSAALVPVLSEYAQGHGGEDGNGFGSVGGINQAGHTGIAEAYQRLAWVLVSVFSLGLTVLATVLYVFAPQLAHVLAQGFEGSNPDLIFLTAHLIRWTAPVVWLLSMAGVCTAMLISLQRFTFPALATAVYNLGVVLAAPLLAGRYGIYALAIGILAGAAAQFLLLTADLVRAGALNLQLFVARLYHPALGRIARLYAPIAVGLLVSMLQVGLDRRLASGTGEQSIAWMSNATTLQQMPLGLISVAISLAALPQLSRFFVTQNEEAYRRTLGRGLRMVLLLIVPAAVGLWLLGTPLARLLFERNRFTAYDTEQVVHALDVYTLGMIFAAVDFPLNYAFYARNNTIAPAVVGMISVLVYVAVAFALLDRMSFLGLVWADTVKQASHAAIMIALLARRVGHLGVQIRQGIVVIGIGALAMGLTVQSVVWIAARAEISGVGGDLFQLLTGGLVGSTVYVLVLMLLRLGELDEVVRAVRVRYWPRSGH